MCIYYIELDCIKMCTVCMCTDEYMLQLEVTEDLQIEREEIKNENMKYCGIGMRP